MKKLILYIFLTLSLTLSAAPALATASPEIEMIAAIPKPDFIPGPDLSEGSRKALTESVLPKFAVGTVGLVAAISLLFLIISGVRFVTSYGNDEAVESAKKQAIYAIVGLLVAMLSYTIVAIVGNFQFSEEERPEFEPILQKEEIIIKENTPTPKESSNTNIENLGKLINATKDTQLDDPAWNKLKEAFSKLSPAEIEKLKEKYPDIELTPAIPLKGKNYSQN
ncbi:hypothetical protein JKY72_02845 [Candidatus Gracilibacteria bacterium]|nr:hypothetical protein [Candidatus Gracilibacteria bacterium]